MSSVAGREPAHPIAGMPHLGGVSHTFVTLSSGLRMHVAESGPRDAPVVLLLHGFPQHWWEWRGVIAPLAEHYRVLAPDLRGAGWSDAPADRYTAETLVTDVLGLLDRLGIESVRLVAHDVGALVGLRLAFDHTERLVAFLCLGPHPYVRLRLHMLEALPQLWFQPVVATPGLGSWALGTRWLPRHLLCGFAIGESITEEDLGLFTARLHAPGHRRAGSATYRQLVLPEMRRLVSGAYRSRRLKVPTVAILGGADRGVRAGDLDVVGAPADDLAGHIVDGAGHFLADDRPDEVVRHALALFARVS